MKNSNLSRKSSFIVLAVIYCVAAVVGAAVFKIADGAGMHYLWSLFAADFAATVFVWFFGLVFKNVSVYDPYWSVAPPVILTWWLICRGNVDLPTVLLLVAVWYWGIRLTGNWAVTFKGLSHEDWRYTKYRTERKPAIFQLINFFGLNMIPTIVVFLAMIPALGIVNAPATSTPLTWVAFAMCLACPTIQWVADTQSHTFRRLHPGEVCNIGLWKRSRHPNYFGEVMMWWSVWLLYVSVAGLKESLWYVAGAVANTLLFLFISIPLMESRQLSNKPAYAEYRKSTRLFI